MTDNETKIYIVDGKFTTDYQLAQSTAARLKTSFQHETLGHVKDLNNGVNPYPPLTVLTQ